MTMPMSVTLTTHDTRFDNPDDALIAKVLASLDGGQNVVATLERSEGTYLQAVGSQQTGFALEYQDGAIVKRYRSRATELPLGQVTEVFQAYAQGDVGSGQGVEWEHVPYVPPTIHWFSTWWGYALALIAVALLIWWWRG
jgi:hypothetical protein